MSLLRYQTFTWAIFIQYETAFDRSVAAALSLALVALALTLLVLESRSRGHGAYYRVTPGTQRTAIVARLGRWRWLAALYASVVVALSLAAPMAILVYWVVRGVTAGEPLDLLWQNTINTVYVSALAAGAAAIGAIPIAVLSVRYPGWLSSLLERLAYVGFALPGLAVALAFVFFGASVLTPLYQTTLLLVAAYVVLFLPGSLGATQAALRQVSPRIEEAARSLGKTSFQTFRLVTLPLLARGGSGGRCDGLPAHDEGATRDAHPEPYRLPHARDVGLERSVRGVLCARGDARAAADHGSGHTDGVPDTARPAG